MIEKRSFERNEGQQDTNTLLFDDKLAVSLTLPRILERGRIDP